MANKNLFKGATRSKASNFVPIPDTVNSAGGKAYKSTKHHALAQIAATNCFNGTFYASAEDNLRLAKEAALALKNDPEFIAKVAIYSRDMAYMKDMPAFLTVMLAGMDKILFRKVFRKVITNGKMLRNVIQMARSGVLGRKYNMSAGTFRHAIQEWFNEKSPRALFKASIGNDPSMRDILRMSRPRPNNREKEALFGYFLNKKVEFEALPEIVQSYEKWKATKEGPVPDVDFRMLDSLGLTDRNWIEIATKAPWQMTRMNLNTFARHGVFKDLGIAKLIADRLRNREEIIAAKQFPYQMYSAWIYTNENSDIPMAIKEALQDAMEISIDNVPELKGEVHVCVDQSGSMSDPITGSTEGRPASKISCSAVAGLIASAVVRKNRTATVWTFNSEAVKVNLNPRDSVVTNAAKLSEAGGGTCVAAPLAKMNRDKIKADVIVYASDYESWLGGNSLLANEWAKFKICNPKAKLICCDLIPRSNAQINNRPDVLQVGGFSDTVFDVMSSFVTHGLENDHWVSEINKVSLDE